MGIVKDLFIEEYDRIMDDAEENGTRITELRAANLAYKRSVDRFADMCDEAKDRAKYERKDV